MLRYFIFLLPFFLTSCAYFSSADKREAAYLNAKSAPALKIPPGLSSDKFNNLYPISDKTYPAAAYTHAIEPPGLSQ